MSTLTAPPALLRARPLRWEPLALVLLGAVWGITPMLIHLVVDHVAPLWLVTGRVWSGLAVVLVVLRLRGARLPRDPRVWLHLTVLGTVGTALPWVLMGWAQQSMSPSLAAVLAAPLPATTMALAVAGRVERVTPARVAGVALALFGTLAIVGGELGGRTPVRALVAATVCTLLFSFGTVYAKRHLRGQPGITVAAGQLVPAALVVLPAALLADGVPQWSGVPLAAWVAWLAMGALSTGLAYAIFYAIVDRSGPTTAQLACYVAPPVGALAGWLLLREPLTSRTLMGMAIVTAGVWVSQLQRLSRRPG